MVDKNEGIILTPIKITAVNKVPNRTTEYIQLFGKIATIAAGATIIYLNLGHRINIQYK